MTLMVAATHGSVNYYPARAYTSECRGGTVQTVSSRSERIRLALREHGWSQRELSRRAGFKTESQLGNVLRRLDKDEAAVEIGTINRIAAALGVSVSWLLTGEGDPGPIASADPLTPDPSHLPETIGESKRYRERETLARPSFAKKFGFAAPDPAWRQVELINQLAYKDSAPSVEFLVQLCAAIVFAGDPLRDPQIVLRGKTAKEAGLEDSGDEDAESMGEAGEKKRRSGG